MDNSFLAPGFSYKASRTASPSPEGTSISVQVKGNQVCVNRNYTRSAQKREAEALADDAVSAGKSRYIYAFPLSLNEVPPLEDESYHKTEVVAARLTESEREHVCNLFQDIRWQRDEHFVRHMLEQEAGKSLNLALDPCPNPNDPNIFFGAQLIHWVVDLIDHMELNSQVPRLRVAQIEQMRQGWNRLGRRFAMMGVHSDSVNSAIYWEHDDRILITTEFDPETGVEVKKNRLGRRSEDAVIKGRMTSPKNKLTDAKPSLPKSTKTDSATRVH